MPVRFLSPAEFAIKQFGGVRPLGRAIGDNDQIAFRWKRKKSDHHGCDGRIPGWYIARILEVSIERGLDVTLHDLIYGREIEVEEMVTVLV